MKILSCFKVEPDLDKFTRSDWEVDCHFSVDTSFVPKVINQYDESALELILKLKDELISQEIDYQLTALSIGSGEIDRFLKNLYALSYDQAVRVAIEEEIRFNSSLFANIIEQYIQNFEKHQFIVMGRQSGIGNNSKTPLLLAEKLDIPCITNATKLELADAPNSLKVTSINDDYQIEQVIEAPAVISIGDVPKAYLRVPTLKDKLSAKEKEIKILEFTDLNLENQLVYDCEDGIELIDLYREPDVRQSTVIEKETPGEIARELYENYLKESLD